MKNEYIQKCKGDGNCLSRALVSTSYFIEYEIIANENQINEFYMKFKNDVYEYYISNSKKYPSITDEELNNFKTKNIWLGEEFVKIFADKYNYTIVIIDVKKGKYTKYGKFDNYLILLYENNHYDAYNNKNITDFDSFKNDFPDFIDKFDNPFNKIKIQESYTSDLKQGISEIDSINSYHSALSSNLNSNLDPNLDPNLISNLDPDQEPKKEYLNSITILDISKININEKNILYMPPQSGKRDYIIQYAIECLKQDISCIIITDTFNEHKHLLEDTLKNIFGDKFKDFIVCDNIDIDITRPRIYLTIMHIKYLKQLKDITCKYNIIIDEGDKVISSSTNLKPSKKSIYIDILTNKRSLFVTSTPFANLYIDKNSINGNCLIIPKVSEEYINTYTKNFSIKCIAYDIKDNDKIITKKKINYIKLHNIINQGNFHTFVRNNKNYNIYGYLINIHINIEIHEEIKNNLSLFIKKSNHNGYIILVNGKQHTVYYVSKYMETIELSEKSIPQLLLEIQNKWTDNDMYLFEIGKHKIARSVPACRSELSKKPKNCNELLLITNLIYEPSDNENQANIIQANRLAGVYFGQHKLKLTLFTTQRAKDIYDNYSQELDKQIQNMKRFPNLKTIESCISVSKELINSIPFSKAQASDYKLIKHNDEFYPTKESVPISKKVYKNRYINDDTIEDKIIRITRNKWLSVKKIYDSCDWNLNSKTPINSVSSRCNELFEKNILKREKRGGVFVYSN